MPKRRRKLRPRERARLDQDATTARELGATGRAAVITTVYADPGVQCCWCDCPDTPDSPHNTQPGYVCPDPCPDPALYVINVLHGRPGQRNIPVCERHSEDAHRTVWEQLRVALPGVPTEVHLMPGLDNQDDDIEP